MNRIVFILLAIILIFQSAFVFAQWVKPEHVTFAGVELRAKEIQHAVFAVQTEGDQKNKKKTDDWNPLGSGFFVKRQDGVLLGVTCRHIVLAAAKQKIYVGFDDQKKGYIRLSCAVDYIDPTHDVAILRPQKGEHKELTPITQTFPREKIGNNSDLVLGRGVLIPGYPLGLGIQADQNHPVFRIGIIAQFTGGSSFLVDGVASHGNSGSPVLSLNDPKVVGMITAHKADRISLFDEHRNRVAALPYNAGLAQGVTAEIIGQILDKLNKKTAQPKDVNTIGK
jgi:S1-C subfamily serine protease